MPRGGAVERDGPAGHNVPVPLTSLIGRSRELDGVIETMRRTRLVTVTGPGGVGKTRLATEVARRQVGKRSDGVWLVDLTAIRSDVDPAAAVARSLEVGGRSERGPVDSLRGYLADRDLLLVIDNCEHVVNGCAQLVASLLGTCARLRVLATSRESLSVSGETVWRLGWGRCPPPVRRTSAAAPADVRARRRDRRDDHGAL